MKLGAIMKEAGRLALPAAILLGGILAFAAIASMRQTPATVERKTPVPLVETVAVEPHQGVIELPVDGVVVPFREINLSAEVGGRITFKSDECRAGHYVAKGTLLLEIDSRNYQLEFDRLKEEVNQAEASLVELDVEIQNTDSLIELAREETALRKKELERYLAIQGKGASDSNVDEVRRAELSARNAAATLENQRRVLIASRRRLTSGRDLAQAKLDKAQLDLDKAKIVAPIDGVVVSESVEQDSFVQAGTSLVLIEDTSAAEVRCNLRMEELNWILRQASPGEAPTDRGDYQLPRTPATVRYRLGESEFLWQGHLSRYEGIGLDEATRTVPVRLLVPEPRQVTTASPQGTGMPGGPRALVRGMYVQVTMHVESNRQLLRLPDRVVQPGNVVWRVREGKLDVVRLRNVTLLNDQVIVPATPEGLNAGDQIVATPLATATEGMSVDIKPAKVAELREVAN